MLNLCQKNPPRTLDNMLSFCQCFPMNKAQHTKAGLEATDLILEVFRLNGILIKSGDRLVKDLGLTSARWQIIGALALSGESMTVPQVARRMGLSRQAVQRIANDLSAMQWIRFQDCASDKRTRLLELTTEGQEVYEKASERQTAWINELTSNISADDIAEAKGLMSRLGRQCMDFDGPPEGESGNGQ